MFTLTVSINFCCKVFCEICISIEAYYKLEAVDAVVITAYVGNNVTVGVDVAEVDVAVAVAVAVDVNVAKLMFLS